jgi:hypothetical protein
MPAISEDILNALGDKETKEIVFSYFFIELATGKTNTLICFVHCARRYDISTSEQSKYSSHHVMARARANFSRNIQQGIN